MQKKSRQVVWDTYWISNNPTKEALEKELDKFLRIQQGQFEKNIAITNRSLIVRQEKINILKKTIANYEKEKI